MISMKNENEIYIHNENGERIVKEAPDGLKKAYRETKQVREAYESNKHLPKEKCIQEIQKLLPNVSKNRIIDTYETIKEEEFENDEYEKEKLIEDTRLKEELDNTKKELKIITRKLDMIKEQKANETESIKGFIGYSIFIGLFMIVVYILSN